MDSADFTFLLTPPGERLLAAAVAAYDEADPITVNERLRATEDGFTAGQVSAALTQAALRHSARAKFGPAAETVFFTSAGLEQATHPLVARHRAERARSQGGGRGVDLGCGIGSDLAALSRAGFVVDGVDSDPLTAQVAAANLAALGLPGQVRVGAAESVDLSDADLVFCDPARRKGTTRVFDPRAFSPSWDFVTGLLAPDGPRRAVVKAAPGLDHELIPPHVEAEWVSLDGDVRELALWSPAPGPDRRRATLLRSDGTRATVTATEPAATTATTATTAPGGWPEVREPGDFLYEPDAAVVRAHLVAAVVKQVDGWLLDPHIAYVSSDRATTTPFARRFRVVEVLPYKEKALRAALRERDIGVLTIKKRGIAVAPETLRQRLRLRGERAATLVLTRTPGSAKAILVEPED